MGLVACPESYRFLIKFNGTVASSSKFSQPGASIVWNDEGYMYLVSFVGYDFKNKMLKTLEINGLVLINK